MNQPIIISLLIAHIQCTYKLYFIFFGNATLERKVYLFVGFLVSVAVIFSPVFTPAWWYQRSSVFQTLAENMFLLKVCFYKLNLTFSI